jgi:hypothetical protein
MKSYEIRFTILGKTLNAKVEAHNEVEAKKKVYNKINSMIVFDRINVKSDSAVDHLMGIFGMK